MEILLHAFVMLALRLVGNERSGLPWPRHPLEKIPRYPLLRLGEFRACMDVSAKRKVSFVHVHT
jgi:hypothetical protein